MKIDYEFSAKLGAAAAVTVMEELLKETKGQPFKAHPNQLVGMYITLSLVFIEHMMDCILHNVESTKDRLAEEFIQGIRYSFLMTKNDLH